MELKAGMPRWWKLARQSTGKKATQKEDRWKIQLSQDQGVQKRKLSKTWKTTTEKARGNNPWSSPRTRNSAYYHPPHWTSNRILRRVLLHSGKKLPGMQWDRYIQPKVKRKINPLILSPKWQIIELTTFKKYYDCSPYVQDTRRKRACVKWRHGRH